MARVRGHLVRKLKSPGFVCIALGATIISLLLMQPVWNSILMLHNPVFVHFVGKDPPSAIITACVCLVVLYMLSVFFFYRYSRKASQNEQNVLLIANVFATMLGALVLIISMPVRRSGMAVESEILEKCQHGTQTHDLFLTYNRLLALRRTPECASVKSVEQCAGFQTSEKTELLKAMEFKYKCSGWCSPPKLQQVLPGAQSVSFLQLDGQHETQQELPTNAASRAWAFKDLRLRLSQLPGGVAMNEAYAYPPTLFSNLNFEATCNGMAARDAHYFLTDTADELYYEGLYLMIISIGIGFLKLLGFCMKDNIFSRVKTGEYSASLYGGTSGRYVSQGMLN